MVKSARIFFVLGFNFKFYYPRRGNPFWLPNIMENQNIPNVLGNHKGLPLHEKIKKMEPRIETIEEKIFIGMSIEMSLVENNTYQLFSTFMPRKKEILNPKNQDVYDLIIYPKDYFLTFNPTIHFKKHALVEVLNLENVPEEMESFTLPKGKYAIFTFKGYVPNQANFEYIFSEWLPNSEFNLDDRPHFDILSEKIQQKSNDAFQEVWIPIMTK